MDSPIGGWLHIAGEGTGGKVVGCGGSGSTLALHYLLTRCKHRNISKSVLKSKKGNPKAVRFLKAFLALTSTAYISPNHPRIKVGQAIFILKVRNSGHIPLSQNPQISVVCQTANRKSVNFHGFSANSTKYCTTLIW